MSKRISIKLQLFVTAKTHRRIRKQDPHCLKITKKLLNTPEMNVPSIWKVFLEMRISINFTVQTGIACKNKILLRKNK